MKTFILKMASKNRDGKNFTAIGLQVEPDKDEGKILRFPSISSLPWLSFVWELETNFSFALEGGWQFVGKVTRCRLHREAVGEIVKMTIEVEKDICPIDLQLSAMVRARDEEGEALSLEIDLQPVQLEAEIEGGAN